MTPSATGSAGATAGTSSPKLRASLRALRKATESSWLLLQSTAAGVVAWLIANEVIGHDDPFFAPIAAVAALNATLGERGSNVLRMMLGVIVGIFVGEITIALLGGGYGRLAIAIFSAMAIARALDASRMVIGQAAASAILTVVVLDGVEVGLDRLIDALIGGGVALVFTQILFTPEPVGLVRRAEAAGLAAIAGILELTAQALEHDDDALAEQARCGMHEVRDRLLELRRMTRASTRAGRHSVIWRSPARWAAVQRENERARQLDLLGGSCLMLTRVAIGATPHERAMLAPSVRELAAAIADLASTFEDRQARQRAADRALDLARMLFHRDAQPQSAVAAAIMTLEIAAVDFMVFVGVDPAKATSAMQEAPAQANR